MCCVEHDLQQAMDLTSSTLFFCLTNGTVIAGCEFLCDLSLGSSDLCDLHQHQPTLGFNIVIEFELAARNNSIVTISCNGANSITERDEVQS